LHISHTNEKCFPWEGRLVFVHFSTPGST
jgi:hypothetical protein